MCNGALPALFVWLAGGVGDGVGEGEDRAHLEAALAAERDMASSPAFRRASLQERDAELDAERRELAALEEQLALEREREELARELRAEQRAHARAQGGIAREGAPSPEEPLSPALGAARVDSPPPQGGEEEPVRITTGMTAARAHGQGLGNNEDPATLMQSPQNQYADSNQGLPNEGKGSDCAAPSISLPHDISKHSEGDMTLLSKQLEADLRAHLEAELSQKARTPLPSPLSR